MKQKALGRKHSEDTKLKMSTVRGNPINIYEKLSCNHTTRIKKNEFELIGSFVSARRAASQ